MGFDIECIIDIHTYPGEYFCPVCRTLVFPNEAVQSQCTHLYCKPCLAHVANGSRACPYDGYLVTEADSKPLIESDKTLAESIGNVKVRCLYHRSGCTWEGPLSDCTSHCSGCSFGNSPVICNRCGVQIVHRQVHEHALSCPGVYPAQQTTNGPQDNPSSGAATIAAGADSNQTTAHSGTLASQTPNPQTTTASLLPGQDPNQQTNASSQALATASAGVPTSEQWYQQQYQQYYQQYAGYDPYQQQTYQQYYPYQQQPQIYMQPPAQPQTPVPAQPQPQLQPLNPQSQPQMQALPKGQTQSQVQALAQQHQNQVQVNPQQQLPPSMQPHTQIPSQIYPTSRAQPPTQPPPYPQSYPMQPHSQHHVQVPQYQQPPPQVQPPPSSQAQPHPPVQPQPHSQLQPQTNVQHHPQSHVQLRPPQAGQPAHALGQTLHSTANAVSGFHSYPQPQPMQQAPLGMTQQPPMHPHPTNGSMPPVQTHGQVPQQPPLMRPPQGLVGNQQTGLVPSQGQPPAQSQLYLTAQQAEHSIQQHPVQPNQRPMSQQYSQQHTFPGPFPSQSHQQGHFTHQQPLQSQFRPQGLPNVVPQNLHAYIQPQQNVTLPPPPQPQQSQTYIGRPGMQNYDQSISQAHGGYNTAAQVRPVQPALSQPQMNSSYGSHTSSEHESMDQKKRSALESKGDQLPDKTAGRPEVGVPSQDNAQKDLSTLADKSIDAMAPRFDADLDDEQQKRRKAIDEYRQRANSDIDVDKGDSDKLADKRTAKEEGNENSLKPKSAAKSADAIVKPEEDAYDDAPKELDQALANHASSDAVDGSVKNLNPGRNSHDATTDGGGFQQYGHEMPPPKYGPPAQQRPVGPMIIPPMQPAGRASHAQVPGYPPTAMMPSGDVPQAGQPLNSRDHHPQFLKQPSSGAPLGGISGPGSTIPFARGHGHFPPPGEFREGITGMGRAPLSGAEIPSGTQHSVNPAEAEMFQNQRVNRFEGNQPNPFASGSFEKVPFGQSRSMESARGKRLKAPMGEHLSPLPVPHDQASGPLDKPPHGLGYDSGSKFEPSAGVPPNRLLLPYHPPGSMHFKDSVEREAPLGTHDDDRKRGGSGFGMHHMDYSTARHPDGEFFNIPPRGFVSHSGFEDTGGREPRQFIEGPGLFNLPSNIAGGLHSDGRFQNLPGHSHGGEIDGLGDLRGGDHTTFGRPYKHVWSGDLFGKDVQSHLHPVEPLDPQKLPSHLRFGEPAGFGPFAGRAYMGELSGSGDIPGFGESIGRNKPGMPRFGEPGFRSRYPVPGYLNHGLYAGDLDSFDRPRKRKHVSMGWCRICKVDCETVEGLDMHSQTREHQDMAMDMVRSIKEQNRKKQKAFSDRASVEEKGKTRKAVFEGRGRKN